MSKTKINLQLFAEGASSDGGATAGTEAEVVTADNNAELAIQQQADTDSLATNNEESFESLIKGKYKDDYDKSVQKILRERLKNSDKPKKELEALKPLVEAAKSRYGIDDVSKLADAFLEDELYISHLAVESGKSKEEVIQDMRAKRAQEAKDAAYESNLEELKKYREADERREHFKKQFQEAKDLQQIYGEFDIEALFNDKNFNDLLNKGLDVHSAFKVVNHDKIVNGVMQKTAEQVKQGVVNSIASGAKRPVENGSSGQGASKTTIDVNSLTDKEILSLLKQVGEGKIIKF